MAISLSQLRIEAVMDASAYVAGANAKAASDAKMVASGQQVDRQLGSSSSALERLTRAIDPAYAASAKLEAAQRTLGRAFDAGRISAEEHARRLDLVQQRYQAIPQSTGAATVSTNQLRFATQNLGFQLNDIATSLASGGSPFRVLAQQAGQVQQAISQGGGIGPVLGSLATSIRSMITPTTLAVAGIGGLVAGVTLLALRSNTSTQAIREFNVVLQGMSVQSLASAQGLEAAAKSLLDVGVNAAEARKQITDIARAGLNPAAAPQIVRTGANLSAYLGGDQTQSLTQALAGGVDAAAKYAVQVGALTGAQAALRQEMARTTPGAKVLDEILQQIATHAEGAYQRGLSPLGKAMNDTRVAWDKFIESLSKSGEVEGFLKGIKDTLNEIEHILRVIAELKAFITGDKVQSFVTGAPSVRATAPALGVAGSGGNSGIVAEAQSMLGMNETRDRSALAAYLSSGGASLDPATVAWCAAFANAVLARQGLAGTGSNVATSFLNWGQGVSGEAAPGDVIVLPRGRGAGQPGGHVGFATGETSLTEQGLMLGMISGNRGNAVTQDWVNANEAVLRRSTDAAAGGVGVAGAGTAASEEAIRQAGEYAAAQKRAAEATRGVGLANAEAQIAAEVAGRTGLDASQRATLATDLRAAAVTRLRNEIANEAQATSLEVAGARSVAAAYEIASNQGKIQESIVKAQAQALQKFGETSSDAAQQYIANQARQGVALEKYSESLKNAQDLLAGRDTQAQLQAQIGLVGQLPEIAQRELTLLQAKQTIERDFPLLTAEEKANRLAMVQATADLNVKLAETQRAQQQIDSIFSSIGSTIQSSIGNVIEGIFDPKKAVNFGKALTDTFRSLGSSLIQGLLVKPLTGSLLGALGASPNVVNQFGTLGGGGLSLGNLFQGAGLAKDVAGLGSSSSGGLFGGVNSFINSSIGPSLGFATPGTGSLSSLIGIESSTLSAIPGISGAGLTGTSATAGSLFGMTTLSSVLPFIGIAGGLLGMLLPSLFGNKKPRNQSSGATLDLSNFSVTQGFSGGNSQIDQQTQQVAQGVQQFLELLKTTGGQLSGSVLLQNGVNTGFTADSSLANYSGRFNLGKDPTAALNTIELALARSLTGISDTMRTVIDQIGDPAEIQSAIAFAAAYDDLSKAADDAFKSVENGKTEIGPFATAMDQITTLFHGLTDQANRFGLALDPINAALAEATTRLQGDFLTALNTSVNEATGSGFINQLQGVYDSTIKTIQESQAIGLGEDPATQDLIRQAYEAQLSSILSGLDDAQLNETIAHFTGLNDAIVGLAQSAMGATSATVDLAAAQQLAAQSAQAQSQIQSYLDQLNATPGTFVSPEEALTNATKQYQEQLIKAQAGDVDALSSITQYADQLIKDIEGYYASSLYGQSLVDIIEQELQGLIGVTPTQQDPAILTNQLLTTQIATTEDVSTTVAAGTLTITSGTQQLIDANNAAAASALAQNTADLGTLTGVTQATASANIAANQAASAALIAANDQSSADIVAQNAADSAALVATTQQTAADITAQNAASAQALIAANDNGAASIIADANASTAAILAGSSADATAIGLVVQNVGNEIVQALSSVLADSNVQAIYDTAAAIVQSDAAYSSNEITAIYGAANSLIQAGNVFASSQIEATYGAASSLINVGATNTTAIASAVYGSAGSIVSTNAVYGNSTIVAISTASATNDNLLTQANSWLNGIYQATVSQNDTIIQQLQEIINRLQQQLDLQRQLAASPQYSQAA